MLNKDLVTMNNKKTMSSLEIVKIINDLRDDDKPEIKHKHFLNKVKKVIGEPAENMAGQYRAGNGQMQPCYYLPKRECHLMVMSESYKVQAAVYDRMTELEEVISYPEALRRLADSIEITQLALENQKIAEAKAEILRIELDKSKDFATIKKVAEYNGIGWQTIEWRELKDANVRISGKQEKIFDANFPQGVNTYHRDAWHEVYPDLDFPI